MIRLTSGSWKDVMMRSGLSVEFANDGVFWLAIILFSNSWTVDCLTHQLLYIWPI